MSTGTTLQDIAHERWGIHLKPLTGRFALPGWFFDISLADRCPTCQHPFECCRRPYTTKSGKKQLYIALICTACRSACGPRDVGLGGYASLTPRSPARSVAGSPPKPSAARTAPRRKTPDPPASSAPQRPRAAPQRPRATPPRPRTTPQQPRAQSLAAAVVEYWRAIELFETQDVDLPSSADRRAGIWAKRFLLAEESSTPWEALESCGQAYAHAVAYTIFVGIYDKDRLHTAMAAAVQDTGFDTDERTPRGQSALFSLEVDVDGIPDLETLTMGSAPWALGGLLRESSAGAWHDGFEFAHTAFTQRVADTLGLSVDEPDDDDVPEPRPLTGSDIDALCRAAASFLGVGDALSPNGSVVTRYRPATTSDVHRADGFLNSMLAADLDRAARDLRMNGPSSALASYLGLADPVRTDIAAGSSRLELEELGSPDSIPAGRWPSRPGEPLSTSQQWAVNAISIMQDAPHGLFGVNGPPGTGKSTLLRDVVADVVTTRASALAQLRTPADAFTSRTVGWSTESWKHQFQTLAPSIAGHEVVVASSNNGAVENVSRELPNRSQLAEEWKTQSYFVDAARRASGEDAWGLLSAVLGNSRNRSAFVSTVWWGNPRDGEAGDQKATRDQKRTSSRPLFTEEMEKRADAYTPDDWNRAVYAFTAAVSHEERLRSERQRAYALILQERTLQPRLHDSLQREKLLRRETDEYADASRKAENELAEASRMFQHLDGKHQRSLEEKPSWWESIWDLGSARRAWRERHAALNEDIADLNDTRLARAQAMDAAQNAEAVARKRVTAQESLTAQIRAEQADVARHLHELRADDRFLIPDEAWWTDPKRQEKCPSWVDEAWSEARSNVFLTALHLHEAFVVATWNTRFKKGLAAAMDAVKGAPGGASEEAVTEAWRYLFLLVPVVSTTFASMGRMFAHVPPRAFGWLVIDEAGQAAPQAAVGGIWRAQRTVAVGDPLQLEPIVSAMNSTQNQLRRLWNVDESWTPNRQSVQRLADSATWLGTSIRAGTDEDLWVGAPLRAHRRCDEPMFSIVNDAVYDGVMVQASPARGFTAEPRTPGMPLSAWVDVTATSSHGKWRPEEGDVLVSLVAALSERIAVDEILVISPFKDVATQAERVLSRAGVSVSGAAKGGTTVGTVHTAQGKQAEAVVFILGSDPRSEGSRRWAASKPNLLNVAVSRAQHALYVIGERSQWAPLPYFDAMAERLRTVDGAQVSGRDRRTRDS